MFEHKVPYSECARLHAALCTISFTVEHEITVESAVSIDDDVCVIKLRKRERKKERKHTLHPQEEPTILD